MLATQRHEAILATAFIVLAVIHACSCSILTTNGWVRGSQETTQRKQLEFVAYRGIPYAKPPVGELRFKVIRFRPKITEISIKKNPKKYPHTFGCQKP